MSKKTRYFVLASGAILAVGLTTGLVASYMGLPVSVFSRAAGPDELQYIPADAAVVAYANVRQVMDSDFRQRVRQLEPESHERNEFQEKTGVNIDQDIDSVIAAMMPQADGSINHDNPEGSVLVLARGRFDQARIEALAIEHGGRSEDYQGKRLMTHVREGDGDPQMAVGFIDVDLLALGSYEAVKKSVDAQRSGHNVVSNTELMKQINELENSNTWAVGRFDAIARGTRLPNEIQAQIPSIHTFSFAGNVNGGVSGIVKAEARDAESAKNLHDIVNGIVALARMQVGSKPEIKTVVDSLQLSADGNTVALSFTVPTEIFDALGALKNQRPGKEEPKQ